MACEMHISEAARLIAGRIVARSIRAARLCAAAPGIHGTRSQTKTTDGGRRNQAVR